MGKGSQFFRPPVTASVCHIAFSVQPKENQVHPLDWPAPRESILVTTADIKAMHERRFLEINVRCDVIPKSIVQVEGENHRAYVISGSAWCVANTVGNRIEG